MTMLQQYNHLDQKGQDLISLFVSPSWHHAQPVRYVAKTVRIRTGPTLSSETQEKIHCFSDPDHGKTLFREIKQTERGSELPPRKPAPPSKPTKKKAKFVKRLPRGTHYEYHDQDGQGMLCGGPPLTSPSGSWQYTCRRWRV